MITKNEFYGAYLITLNKSDDDAVSILSVLKDVEFAWSVVESLQEKDLFKDSGINLKGLPFTTSGVWIGDDKVGNQIIDPETGEAVDEYSDKMPDGRDR